MADPKNLVERFGKAMRFHQSEPRKYKLLDEEKAKQAALEEAKHKAVSDHDGDGEVESPEDEFKGSKDKAIKKSMHSHDNKDYDKKSEKGKKLHKKKHK